MQDEPDEPSRPDNRSVRLAELLRELIVAEDEPAQNALLRDSTDFLLKPFRGIPETGSVYGDGNIAEKLDAYQVCAVMRQQHRINMPK